MDDNTIRPKPLNEPTVMSMNIFKIRVFQIYNRHFHDSSPFSEERTYDRVCQIDSDVFALITELPWYFQLQDGELQHVPDPLKETLTWQHHILRTLINTQRIRMFKFFLHNRIGDAWNNCVSACVDAMTVYDTLRQDVSPTSHSKFLPQAYQIFSVAVTVATMFLVEGHLPVPNVLQRITDMAEDLQILETQGCPVPIATNGRRVLLRLLELCNRRAEDLTAHAEAQRLVPDISIILGGERSTSAYINGLVNPTGRARIPTMNTMPTNGGEPTELLDRTGYLAWASQEEVPEMGQLSQSNDVLWEDSTGYSNLSWAIEGTEHFELLDWDISGILPRAHR